MASAGTVTVDFAAETAKFTAELKQVNARLKDMETGFGGMAVAAKTAFSLISVGVLTNFAKQAWNAADAVGDMASRLGVSVESLSRLQYAADQNDVSFESLSVGIKNLQKNLAETDPVFSKLGLSAKALKELSLEQQFASLAEAFRNVQNPADQTRIAMQLFGKAGVDLVPLLNQGAAGIAEFIKQSDELGITLDGKTVGAIDRTDKALKRLNATLQSWTIKGISVTETAAENFARLFHGSDTVEGRLTDQMDALLSQRSTLLQRIATDEKSLENSGATAGRVLKSYIDANKRDLAEVEAQANKINAQLLSIDQQRSQAQGTKSGAAQSDGLEEFSSSLLQNQLTGGAAIAAQADEELAEIMAQRRLDIEQAEFDSYVRRLQTVQNWKDGVESIFADVGANFAAEQEKELDTLIELSNNKLRTQTKFEEDAAADRLQATQELFSGLSTLQNAGSKRAFEIGKAASIANATVKATEIIIKAYDAPTWYQGVAQAISASATLYAQIDQLKNTQYQGYMSGGYTGDGATDEVAGVVHRGEYVMDAATTARLGTSNLDAMRRGSLNGVNINVLNNVGAEVSAERLSSGDVQIMIDRAIAQKTPTLVATELSSPNSLISKSISRNTHAPRRR